MAFNMDPKKCPMPTQDPNVRNKNFEEVALGYTAEMAVNEAKRCIGCNYCIASCPYDARWSHPDSGLPSKCMGEGCLERVHDGLLPACVSACSVSARLFGDINDPDSAISAKLRVAKTQKLLESHGTQPNFFVVVQK